MTMRRRPIPLALAALAVLPGCGAGDDKPVQLPAERKAEGATYRGRTSQGEDIRIEATGRARAELRLKLRCGDGSRTEATLITAPRRPTVESDGSFYYSETGRARFRGFGEGRYRGAVAGQLQGQTGAGTASFRISFKSTGCRGNARWSVRTS